MRIALESLERIVVIIVGRVCSENCSGKCRVARLARRARLMTAIFLPGLGLGGGGRGGRVSKGGSTISDLHRAFSDITAGDRSREILKKSSTVTVNNTINSQPGRGFLRGRKIPGGASVKTFDLKHYLRIFNRTKKEIIDPRNDLQPKTHRCKIILSEKWEETNCAQGFFYSEWSPGRSRVRCC